MDQLNYIIVTEERIKLHKYIIFHLQGKHNVGTNYPSASERCQDILLFYFVLMNIFPRHIDKLLIHLGKKITFPQTWKRCFPQEPLSPHIADFGKRWELWELFSSHLSQATGIAPPPIYLIYTCIPPEYLPTCLGRTHLPWRTTTVLTGSGNTVGTPRDLCAWPLKSRAVQEMWQLGGRRLNSRPPGPGWFEGLSYSYIIRSCPLSVVDIHVVARSVLSHRRAIVHLFPGRSRSFYHSIPQPPSCGLFQ